MTNAKFANETFLAIASAENAKDLWDVWRRQMTRFGFDRCLYGFSFYTSVRTGHLGAETDFIIFSNHDKEYLDAYFKDLQIKHAPLINWAMRNTGAISWAEIQRVSKELNDPKALEVMKTNERFGVLTGYTVSFKSVSERARGAISLCAKPGLSQQDVEDIWMSNGETIVSICNFAHLKMLTLPLGLYQSSLLTPKQREVLEWTADGKTLSEISEILGKSQTMIEKHLRNARNALNVVTTAQAVLKAMQLNQLFLPEDADK